jgi:phospholipase/lecithinase/hemolysin
LLAALTATFTDRLALRVTLDPNALEAFTGTLAATVEARGATTSALELACEEMERNATALERATIDETDMLISYDELYNKRMGTIQANVSGNGRCSLADLRNWESLGGFFNSKLASQIRQARLS